MIYHVTDKIIYDNRMVGFYAVQKGDRIKKYFSKSDVVSMLKSGDYFDICEYDKKTKRIYWDLEDLQEIEEVKIPNEKVSNKNSKTLVKLILDDMSHPFNIELTQSMLISGDTDSIGLLDKKYTQCMYLPDNFDRQRLSVQGTPDLISELKLKRHTIQFKKDILEDSPFIERQAIKIPKGTVITYCGTNLEDLYTDFYADLIDYEYDEETIAQQVADIEEYNDDWDFCWLSFTIPLKTNKGIEYIIMRRKMTDLMIGTGLYTSRWCVPFTGIYREINFEKLDILGIKYGRLKQKK